MGARLDIFDKKARKRYLTEVTALMERGGKSPILVGEKLLAAKTELDRWDFAELVKSVPFDKSTIYKLIKIARSQRLQDYADKLVLIKSWSTLYEIIQLSGKQFEEFRAKHLDSDLPQYFKRSDVTNVKYGTTETPTANIGSVFAEIRVEADKIENSDQLDKIRERLECLSDLTNVNVKFTDLQDRIGAKWEREQSAILAEAMAEATKRLREVYKEELRNSHRKVSGRTQQERFLKLWGVSKEEIFEHVHPNTMLEFFGREPVRTDILGPTPLP